MFAEKYNKIIKEIFTRIIKMAIITLDIGTVVRFGDNLVPTETVHWHQSVYNKPDGNQTLEQSGRVTVGLGPIVSGVWR